jgi:hypothetical protein
VATIYFGGITSQVSKPTPLDALVTTANCFVADAVLLQFSSELLFTNAGPVNDMPPHEELPKTLGRRQSRENKQLPS